MTSHPTSPSAGRRGWLASLLLRQPERFLPRLLSAAGRWRDLPRRLRRRIQRQTAASALAAALLLAMGGAAFYAPPAHAATIEVDNGYVVAADDGFCSLREAIRNANSNSQVFTSVGECEPGSGDDVISLPEDGLFNLLGASAAYYVGQSEQALPAIGSVVTIEGNGSTIRRGADTQFRLLSVGASGDLTLNDVTLSNGNAMGYGGGAIYSVGTLTINDSNFLDNSCLCRSGGAIFIWQGTVEINDSYFAGNHAPRYGGAIVNYLGTLTISGTTITGNSGNWGGGGVYNMSGALTINDSEITLNRTNRDGGGVFINNGTVNITGSQINENTATGTDTSNTHNGGGLIINNGSLTISESEVNGNSSNGKGGGVMVNGGSFTLEDSEISGNSAVSGGGVYHKGSLFNVDGSTISENTSTGNGGGIFTMKDALLVNSTVSGNQAGDNGGGIYVHFNDLSVRSSTLTGNGAATYGGGVALSGERPGGLSGNGPASLDMKNSIVSGNTNERDEGHEIYNWRYPEYMSLANSVIGRAGLTFSEAVPYYSLNAANNNFNATDSGTPTALENILNTNLAANGGPTKTHLLAEGSPALDLAPSAECAADPVGGVDQRGEPRNIDADNDVTVNECDAGAVEGTEAIVEPPAVFLSTKKAGSVDGVAFGNEDILKWKEGVWTVWFDGSAAGLAPNDKPKHNTNAFWFPDEEEQDVVIAFAQNRRKVPDISQPVDGTDLVWWDGAKFTFWFDGSDVDLKVKTKEKIDGLHVLPGSAAPDEFGGVCEAYLLISTQGPGKVQRAAAFGGGALKFGGEDVLGFCATSLGEDTAGLWHMALDGSAVGLAKNSVDGISLSDDGQTLFLTMKKAVKTPFVVGHSKVVAVDLETGVVSGPYFSAPDNGLNRQVDGLQVEMAINE